MSYSSKFEGEVQTLRLKRDPFYYGLGIYEDADGRRWDVHACIGIGKPHPYINAHPMDSLHPHWGSTALDAGNGFASQTWEPYYVIVIDAEGNVVKDYRETKDERTRAASASNVPVSEPDERGDRGRERPEVSK